MRYMKKKPGIFVKLFGVLIIASVFFLLITIMVVFLTQAKIRRISHPEYPYLKRFNTNAHFTQQTFGDLSAMSGKNEWRVMRNLDFFTDQWGFANNPNDLKKDSCIDILTLGDSFTASLNTFDSIWPRRLAQLSDHSVYNLGHPAEGPWSQLQNFQVERGRLKFCKIPTLVWATFSGNDLDDYIGKQLDLPAKKSANLTGRVVGYVSDKFTYSIIGSFLKARKDAAAAENTVQAVQLSDGRNVLFHKLYVKNSLRTEQDVVAHKNHAKFISIFERMKKLCAEQSIRLVVVCMPSKAEVYPWILDPAKPKLSATGASGYSSAIAKICGQLDIPYLDMTPLMADAAVGMYKSTGDMFYWEDDTHFNHIGHDFVGKKIDSAFFKTNTP